MGYKEYKASNDNVLINLDSFSYGGTVICGINTDLKLIEVKLSDATILHEETYLDELVNMGYDLNNRVTPIIHE